MHTNRSIGGVLPGQQPLEAAKMRVGATASGAIHPRPYSLALLDEAGRHARVAWEHAEAAQLLHGAVWARVSALTGVSDEPQPDLDARLLSLPLEQLSAMLNHARGALRSAKGEQDRATVKLRQVEVILRSPEARNTRGIVEHAASTMTCLKEAGDAVTGIRDLIARFQRIIWARSHFDRDGARAPFDSRPSTPLELLQPMRSPPPPPRPSIAPSGDAVARVPEPPLAAPTEARPPIQPRSMSLFARTFGACCGR